MRYRKNLLKRWYKGQMWDIINLGFVIEEILNQKDFGFLIKKTTTF